TGEVLGQQTEKIVKNTKLFDEFIKSKAKLINQTVNKTIEITWKNLDKELNNTLTSKELEKINKTLINSSKESKKHLIEEIYQDKSRETQKISKYVKNYTVNKIKGKNFFIFVPVAIIFFFLLQPIIGVPTAIFAKIFEIIFETVEI
ncbi:MAG: hypothetical protein ABEI78_00100, partial [Candidatus Nanohaloarchaea archaeon]